MPYRDAWRWQTACADGVRRGDDDALAVLEHPPVYTFGHRARSEHLLLTPSEVESAGAELVQSNRGGDITFHGPGQLVAYPILQLRRHGLGVADYVGLLEETLLRALRMSGIWAVRVPGRPGVWLNGAKIGAIGVRVQGGVTLHGFALNVNCDLSWFDHIVPCGIPNACVTSMERALGYRPGMDVMTAAFVSAFVDVFEFEPVPQHAVTLAAAGGGVW